MGVCDLTRKDSLYALNEWIPSALEIAGDVPVYLIVNKRDLEERRAISEDEVRHVAEAFAAPIVYVSARTGALVDDAFNALAIEMVDRAFRQDAARAVERGLRDKVLLLLDKRGSIGLKKNQLFEILRGVNFDDLQSELGRLEGEGLVTLLWHGASDFTAVITPRGVAAPKREAAWGEELVSPRGGATEEVRLQEILESLEPLPHPAATPAHRVRLREDYRPAAVRLSDSAHLRLPPGGGSAD